MSPRRDLHEANRRSWNAATVAHNSHKRDQAAFLRSGGSTLFPEELALLGDIRGKKLVHLQCNAGQDSLSLALLGAAVTGVDISDEAVRFARELSAAAGIEASFVRSDVYDWFEQTAVSGERFDLVYTSYGALPWLSDITAWGRGIATVLAPGGRLVTIEFHPLMWVFEPDWSRRFDYFPTPAPFFSEEGVNDYVGASEGLLSPSGHDVEPSAFVNPHPSYEFQWPVADVVTALLDAGLELEALKEYPYANGWKPFENMRTDEERRTWPPAGMPDLPMMFSLAARAPAGH